MEQNLWKHIQSVRSKSPLVHNITNYVVMNNTANALLAVGASPIMAHAKSEVHDMVALASSTFINIGTLDEYWSEAMLLAAETAHTLGKPWVLDPVGAGARSQELATDLTYSKEDKELEDFAEWLEGYMDSEGFIRFAEDFLSSREL